MRYRCENDPLPRREKLQSGMPGHAQVAKDYATTSGIDKYYSQHTEPPPDPRNPPVTTTMCVVAIFTSDQKQIKNSLMEVRASSCCARLQWERLGKIPEARQRMRGIFDKFDTLCALPNFFTPLRLTGLTAAMVRGNQLQDELVYELAKRGG